MRLFVIAMCKIAHLRLFGIDRVDVLGVRCTFVGDSVLGQMTEL